MMAAHVALTSKGIQVQGKECNTWWYDEANACIHLIEVFSDKRALFIRSLSSKAEVFPAPIGAFSLDTTFVNVRLSIDKSFVALQRNDVEVDIWTPLESHCSVMCKRSSRILGLIWNAKETPDPSTDATKSPSQYLVLVTTEGIEVFKVTSNKCKFHRFVAHAIHAFWFHPLSRLLVINTGAKRTELRPFILDGGGLLKCSKVVVSAPISTVFLAQLYKTRYIVVPSSSQLLLYRVHPNLDTVCVRALHVGFTDAVCSVVDHLLVAHSPSFGVSCIYDVGVVDSNEPFLHPLPLEGPQPARFLSPNYALVETNDSSSIHTVQVDLDAVAACADAGSKTYISIARFLLRRANAKSVFFQSLLVRLEDHRMSLDQLSELVHLVALQYAGTLFKIQTGNPQSVSDLRSPSHMAVLLQKEWLHDVWLHATETLALDHLTAYLLFYVESLRRHGIAVDSAIYILYVETLAKQRRHHDLIRLPLEDSRPLARALESQRHVHPPTGQMAMDMYHRLGAVDDLVRLLVHDGNVTMGLRLAARYMSSQKKVSLDAEWFFQAVVDVARRQGMAEVKCMQLFYSLYMFLSSFAPTDMARDGTTCSSLGRSCSFPDHLVRDDPSRAMLRRLFGFPNTA
ncbi:hypothetical protein Ae201684P_003302 [Aphanomyces euteiches]|uniref:Uncharacterized protein n=1 Tax=Aphanomyces euteiches TaxID=100861 RepID=A0A6G0W403_9STRA|nr:hypothetical protein Ae201684_018845 [Aphanomyces euteiches]KAH9073799.1 hypothetical protein Ae201684P_003302 [Aphanomyces euteiches]